MSADTLFLELVSLDEKERGRFFALVQDWDFSKLDPETLVKYCNEVSSSTKKWYTAEDLDALIESMPDEDDDSV